VSFTEIATRMWPMWFMGGTVAMLALSSSHSDLLRVTPSALKNWAKILVFITIFRLLSYIVFGANHSITSRHTMETIASIPLLITFTVPWEDFFCSLPVLLMDRIIKNKKLSKILQIVSTVILMVFFGSGHIYQGYLTAIFLSLYVPWSLKLGKEYGVGTVAICHVMYDFCTLLTVKIMLGI
jgi:hypothetical protein